MGWKYSSSKERIENHLEYLKEQGEIEIQKVSPRS